MPLASMSNLTSICGSAARCRRQAFQIELAEQAIVGRHLPLALVNLHGHRRLIGLGRAEDLFLLGGNRRVAIDQLGHDAAESLDAQGQRRHVQQKNVLDFAGQHAALDRRADGHDLVRVDTLVRLLAEHCPHEFLDLGNPRRAAHQNHFIDFVDVEMRILHRLVDRPAAALDQVIDQLLELRPRKRQLQVLRTGCVGRDERQVEFGLLQRS